MSKVLKIEVPTKEKTIMDPKEIAMKDKRFAKVNTLATLYDVSYSTVYRWLNNLDETKFPRVYVELSSSLRLINLEEFDKYLYSMHKKYL
ncbi:helix-turn-helix domain-containing protein [Macrococcoides goetzii]|uniref:Helix-turn-helix domain-containing protein n=1 Tax=Macrococcoides goetzii TaxID=1891097 RepID=A0A364JNN8_9STAP|nr:pathogenicity island protein [Macrococcus goetzii]RAI82535.1 helix-turn-helix domain-containing protein [Macrococcus goetzii]